MDPHQLAFQLERQKENLIKAQGRKGKEATGKPTRAQLNAEFTRAQIVSQFLPPTQISNRFVNHFFISPHLLLLGL